MMNEELQQQKLQAEFDKLNLENEKLATEIKILQRKWYKNPHNLAPLATIIIGALGLTLTFMTGIFDAKRLDLQNQKSLLQIEISKFTAKKDSINNLVASSIKTLDSIKFENDRLKRKFELANKQLKDIVTKYNVDKKNIVSSLSQIDKLLKENKPTEAFEILSDLVNKLNNISERSFSDEFNDDFK